MVINEHFVKSFQNFRLDTKNHCLWRAEERVRLAPKAFDILRFMVENAGDLISHDLLLDTIWPETYVNPEILRKYILEIRKALGDSFKQPLFIETRPKRGYRFIARVEDARANEHSASPVCIPCARDAKIETLAAALCDARNAITDLQSVILSLSADIGDQVTCDLAAYASDTVEFDHLRRSKNCKLTS